MSKAREIVLKLVAEGKISVEEAEELLDAIEGRIKEPFPDVFDARKSGWNRPREEAEVRRAEARQRQAEARERAREAKVRAAEAKTRAKQAAKTGTGYKGGFNFNFPWDQPDWQWPWEAEGWQWPWEQAGWPGGQAEEEEGIYTVEVPENARLVVSTAGGDLVVQGNGQAASLRLVVPGAPGKVMVEDGVVQVASAGEDVVVEVPKNVASMEITHNGGDLTIGKLEAGLVAKVAGGDMTVSEVTGNIQAAVEGGDVSLTSIRSTAMEVRANGGDAHLSMLPPVTEGSVILSSSNDISLVLPADSRCEISATAGGDINHDLPPETQLIEESENYLKVMLNGGGAEFTLSSSSGDIEIRT